MSEPREIYDRDVLNKLITSEMKHIVDATLVMNYIDRLENRIKWITKRSRMACEIVGDHFVDEALMYAEMNDDA